MVWPETLSQTPWLINESAGGPPFGHAGPQLGTLPQGLSECCDLAVHSDGAIKSQTDRQ